MEKRKPSKGIVIAGIVLILFAILQLFFVPSALREFGFLSPALLALIVGYLTVYYVALITAAMGAIKMKKWARGLVIVLMLVGIFDKAVFVPLRLRAVESIRTQPRLLSLLKQEYRTHQEYESAIMSEQQLTDRIIIDLRNAQKALEATWLMFLITILFFFSNRNVRKQFDTDIQR